MNKKQIILELFNETEWLKGHEGVRIKTITREDFERKGLYGDIENSQQHCDVIYARKIIQALGHRVIVGGAFHVWENMKVNGDTFINLRKPVLDKLKK